MDSLNTIIAFVLILTILIAGRAMNASHSPVDANGNGVVVIHKVPR